MPRVRIKTGPNSGLVHNVGDETLTMGRDTTCTIQILDKGASRNHAEIFRIGEMCFIRDLTSRNGTYVNDEKVGEELLREGDRIQIGSTVLVFESSAQVRGETKGIRFTEASEEDFGQTLELRLDDLAGFDDEDEKAGGRDTANFRALYRLGKIISAERDEQQLMNKVLKFLLEGAQLIVMIPEKVDHSLGRVELTVGAYGRMLADAAEIEAVYIGKPGSYMFDTAIESMQIDRGKVLMVGDRVATDILGARRAGIKSALVKTGEFKKSDLGADVQPDFIADTINEIGVLF